MKTPVREILSQKGHAIVMIAPSATVYEAVEKMVEKNVGSLIIENAHGKLAGIFVERDCFRKVLLAGKEAKETLVKDVMTKKVVVATPEMNVDECMAMMTDKRIRHLPVVDAEGKLVGVISIGDLVKFVSAEQEAMIKNLEKYIEGSL